MSASPAAFSPIPRDELRLQQLNQLYAQSRLPQWLLLVTAVLITPLAWAHSTRSSLLVWIALLGLLVATRQVLVGRYWQASARERLQRRWSLFFHLGNLASGLCLSWVHIALTPLDNFALQAQMYSIASGVSICVGVLYAPRYSAFASFMLPAWLPPVIWLLADGTPSSLVWAQTGAMMFCFILLAAALIHRTMRNALISNLRNEALLGNLGSAHQHTEELNQQLTREINQRRRAEQSLRDSHDDLEERVRQRTAELEKATHDLQASEAQLTLAMEASQLGLWDWDLTTDKVYHSRLNALFGMPDEYVPSMRQDLRPLVHPADVTMVRRTLVRHMKSQTAAYRMEYRVRHSSGHWLWVEDSGRAVERAADGRVLRMIGTRRDISARKHQDEQAQLASTVFEATSEGIFILGPTLDILAVNQAYTVITGLSQQDAVGHNILDLSGSDDLRQQFLHLQQLLNNQDRWQGEMTARRRNGELFPIWLQLAVVRSAGGQLTHYVGFFADLTTHRQTEEQLQYLTNYDPLTQLANRSLFTDRLQDAVARARQHHHAVALLHIDLDRFKHINVTLGHAVADGLLQEVARRLSTEVDSRHTLARLSADEFVVIVEQADDEQQLGVLASQLLEALRKPMLVAEHELVTTASIGISVFPATARDSLLLITQANQAMQHAKHLGGNRWQFYTRELRAYSLDRLQLENQLRKAIDEDQLVVHFQPKLHLASDRICSAEALVRWQHPDRGLVMPGDFITIAEETGMIVTLGQKVLDIACEQAALWCHQGPQSVAVSVNLSVQQLRQEGFAERVRMTLQRHNLPARLLELELTESMLAEHSDQVAENVAALRALGVSLSVDDFGTGYSSLAYLKRFPISTLKIDRAFVAELDAANADNAIVLAIIAMARSLSLKVVAEGVEHEGQLNFLKANGCDEVQGYLISRPIEAGAFTRLLEQNSCQLLDH
ncbi:putative bifunctional diguanylate cyclase/phosphodiesterase [Pseudomonas abyssi]|uniref:putative bifunctional diguanylate cyclase/phosphodiesterase n=1 Tax=Pseudomonas abyssi TaxID=170540 RepID=UPI003C7BB9FC